MPSGAKNLICHNPFLPPPSLLVKVKEAVVENYAVLSYAVEREGHTYLDPNVKVSNVLMCPASLELLGFICVLRSALTEVDQ